MSVIALQGRSRKPQFRVLLRVLRQLALIVLALWAISVITFAATNFRSPEEVARSAGGRFLSASQLAVMVKQEGLDKPWVERYEVWLGNVLKGDLGTSPVTGKSVASAVIPSLARSLILALSALALALPIAIMLGGYLARRAARRSSLVIVILIVALSALPEFVIGLGLLLLLGVEVRAFPIVSSGFGFTGFVGRIKEYGLPTLTLALVSLPYLTRMAREAFREALSSNYVRAAVLRGLPARTVIWRHAMPNAAVPLVNAVSTSIVWLFSGVLVVETVFSFPGVGKLLIDSIASGDIITVQAAVLISGALFVALSLLADLLVLVFNPRLRRPR